MSIVAICAVCRCFLTFGEQVNVLAAPDKREYPRALHMSQVLHVLAGSKLVLDRAPSRVLPRFGNKEIYLITGTVLQSKELASPTSM